MTRQLSRLVSLDATVSVTKTQDVVVQERSVKVSFSWSFVKTQVKSRCRRDFKDDLQRAKCGKETVVPTDVATALPVCGRDEMMMIRRWGCDVKYFLERLLLAYFAIRQSVSKSLQIQIVNRLLGLEQFYSEREKSLCMYSRNEWESVKEGRKREREQLLSVWDRETDWRTRKQTPSLQGIEKLLWQSLLNISSRDSVEQTLLHLLRQQRKNG